MIGRENEKRRAVGLLLLCVPAECSTAVLGCALASPGVGRAVRDKANQLGCKYFELKIGRSSAVPFFIDLDGDTFTFNGTDIGRSSQFCGSCKEPLAGELERCSWCQIDDSHTSEAAARNTYS